MSGKPLMKPRALLMVTCALLMTGCGATTPSGTDAACDSLRPHLPSWSSQDTEQSKVEGAKFLDVFAAVCD